jgi:hypothetical protein
MYLISWREISVVASDGNYNLWPNSLVFLGVVYAVSTVKKMVN